MVEAKLYSHLKASTELAELVADRIYPITAPENCETPYVTYQNINYTDETSVQGDIHSEKALFQIDVFSKSYSEVKEVKGAVKDAMYQFEYFPHYFNARDLYEKDTQLHRQLIEFNILI